MSTLVDTGAWYALADASDRHHARAQAFYKKQAGKASFLTTDLILAETWTLLGAHLGRRVAMAFWGSMRETRSAIVTPEPADLEAAWHIAHAYPDQSFSFVDCTTFALMERLGIDNVFAFDAHFLIYRFGPGRRKGFHRLPAGER